jgi:hypothetical protein
MGTQEHKKIRGSPPSHNSLRIFCWGRSVKIRREIKREVFMWDLWVHKIAKFITWQIWKVQNS